MSAPCATRSNWAPITKPGFSFPKDCRLLRTSEFKQVYQKGFRVTGPMFAAFCWKRDDTEYSRVGFTVPRVLGKATVRSRLKRRMRESVRLRLALLGPGWSVVFNPRRGVLTAPFEQISGEVERVFLKCAR